MRHLTMFALALATLPTTTSAQEAATDSPAYCSELQQIVSIAMTKGRFSDIAGKPQQGEGNGASPRRAANDDFPGSAQPGD